MNSIDRSRRRLAVAAAALAGYVDAAGFLSANSYFVSFMSGNTTRLGVDLATSPAAAAVPALLILGFVTGVFGGALLAAWAGTQRKFAVLALVALLLGGAALAGVAKHTAVFLSLLVLAMGALNNTFQRDGEVSVGLTYMTGALVRFAQGLAARVLGRRETGWLGWLMLWLGLALGAVAGATVWLSRPDLALWLAAAWAAGLALAARRLAVS
ncbi:MAG: DUF1275 family protein [Sphingomonadales bacterium]|nr:DUF1275 family protein [Sphingomonadales bacterium]